jgi:WD40 repeat protein
LKRKIIFLSTFISCSIALQGQSNSDEIQRLQQRVVEAEKKAAQSEAAASRAERAAKNMRYQAIAFEIAERSIEIQDKELSTLLAVLSFNFNKKAWGNPFNNKIYTALLNAIKSYDQQPTDNAETSLPNKMKRTSAFIPNSRTKVVAEQNGNLRFVNENGVTTTILSGHLKQVDQIEFSGDRMITAGEDNSIRIWSLTMLNHRPLVIKENASISNLSFNGKQIMYEVATVPKTIKIVPVDMEEMVATLCKVLTRNLTKGEWYTYVGVDLDYESVCSKSND